MLTPDDLRFFAIVARSPTLAAAARELDVTAPAVSQRLQLLEARLRVSLVDRSTRRLALTSEGELLLERGGLVLTALDDLSETLSLRRGEVGGRLRVAAPFGFGRRFIAPLAAQFREANPETTVELVLSETPLRLGGDSWDVLVHVGELRDSTLIAQKLAPNDRVLCASPAYLARRGTPAHPDDLRGHDCIALRENDEDVTLWRMTDAAGETVTVRVEASMASNDGDVARGWALAGRGVVVRSEWDVADDLREGRLVRLLPAWHLPDAPVTALLGQRQHRTARVTRFLDMLRAAFVRPPWRP